MKNQILSLVEGKIELVKSNYISNELEILEDCCDDEDCFDDECNIIKNLFKDAITSQDVIEIISIRDFSEIYYGEELLNNINILLEM